MKGEADRATVRKDFRSESIGDCTIVETRNAHVFGLIHKTDRPRAVLECIDHTYAERNGVRTGSEYGRSKAHIVNIQCDDRIEAGMFRAGIDCKNVTAVRI